jgi:hypothetical protein
MTREEVYEAWAPRSGVGGAGWSDWVKPILFAQMPTAWTREPEAGMRPPLEIGWPDFPQGCALVIDLPGDMGVLAAVALAERGFRPVPLYNGAADGQYVPLDPMAVSAARIGAALNVWPIMAALWASAASLEVAPIPEDAPPAFILDSRRRAGDRAAGPGMVDNRWISFPTDFPSGRMLLDRGIDQAVVIMQGETDPATDLSHTLLGWQQAGIGIGAFVLGTDAAPRAITVSRPNMYRAAWYQMLQTFGLRRSLLGGFGGLVPSPSSG